MELEKQGNSDGSSGQESDRVYQDMAGTAKRSYGCTFCKRGFTNAQALGGHMNIHRKDRAKAKQPSSSSVRNDHQLMDQDHHMNPSYLPPISPTQVPTKYYPVLEDQRMNNNNNYHMYFQPPLLSSLMLSYGHVYDRSKFVVAGGSQSLSINEEVLGANLSLQVGPAGRDSDRVRRGIMEQDEVDLELRLGHNP